MSMIHTFAGLIPRELRVFIKAEVDFSAFNQEEIDHIQCVLSLSAKIQQTRSFRHCKLGNDVSLEILEKLTKYKDLNRKPTLLELARKSGKLDSDELSYVYIPHKKSFPGELKMVTIPENVYRIHGSEDNETFICLSSRGGSSNASSVFYKVSNFGFKLARVLKKNKNKTGNPAELYSMINKEQKQNPFSSKIFSKSQKKKS